MGSMKTEHMKEYQQKLRRRLLSMTVQAPPQPWHGVTFVHVGGPEAIGFGADSDLLLLVSVSGRSVVDCASGEKIARDQDDSYSWFDTTSLTAEGIGPLESQHIRISGVYGGGMPTMTSDGWRLEVVAPDWPYSFVLLHAPGYLTEEGWKEGVATKVAPRLCDQFPDEVLAFGFSPTGKSFAVMMRDGVEIFHRAEGGTWQRT